MSGLTEAYPRPASASNQDPPVFEHDGKRLPFFQLADGRWVCKARDLGRALGYATDGKGLLVTIRRDWEGEFEEGVEFKIAKGQDMAGVEDSSTLNRRGEMMLTREGVNIVCIKTDKPLGKAIRRWLSRDALIQIQDTGRYESPGAAPSSPLSSSSRPVQLMEDTIARALDAGVTDECLARLTAARLELALGRTPELPPLEFKPKALPAPSYQTSLAFEGLASVPRHMVTVVMAPDVLKKLRAGDEAVKRFIRAAVNDCVDHPERGMGTVH